MCIRDSMRGCLDQRALEPESPGLRFLVRVSFRRLGSRRRSCGSGVGAIGCGLLLGKKAEGRRGDSHCENGQKQEMEEAKRKTRMQAEVSQRVPPATAGSTARTT